MFRALLDTCVLFKPTLCDTLLSIAEEGVYQPLWSTEILNELRRNLALHGVSDRAIAHRFDQMKVHFPDSTVENFEQLMLAMTNDSKDRHVLAAAVRGGADLLVTENLADFPAAATKPYDIEVVSQDCFLLDQLDLAPQQVRRALQRQVSRYKRSPRTVEDLLITLGKPGNGCPEFARQCHSSINY